MRVPPSLAQVPPSPYPPAGRCAPPPRAGAAQARGAREAPTSLALPAAPRARARGHHLRTPPRACHMRAPVHRRPVPVSEPGGAAVREACPRLREMNAAGEMDSHAPSREQKAGSFWNSGHSGHRRQRPRHRRVAAHAGRAGPRAPRSVPRPAAQPGRAAQAPGDFRLLCWRARFTQVPDGPSGKRQETPQSTQSSVFSTRMRCSLCPRRTRSESTSESGWNSESLLLPQSPWPVMPPFPGVTDPPCGGTVKGGQPLQ